MYMNTVNRNTFNDLHNNLMCLSTGIMNKKKLHVCTFSLIFRLCQLKSHTYEKLCKGFVY